jgi:hypothetical protein
MKNQNPIRKGTFENPALYSQYLAVEGMRVSEGTTRPSVYITELKLKKALASLSDVDIENIYGKEMSAIACSHHRDKIIRKLQILQEWQLFTALNILLEYGRIEAITYVKKCRLNAKQGTVNK